MKNLKQKKTKSIFVSASASVLFMLCALGGYIILERMLHTARISLEKEYLSVLALGEKELRTQSLESNAESVRIDIEQLQKYTIDADTPVVFVQQVEGLADFSGATVEVTSLSIKERDAQTRRLVVAFTGTGSWDEVVHLLKLVEGIPVRSDVEEIELTFKSDAGAWVLEGTLATPLFEKKL